MPVISVIMGAYNCSSFVESSIESIRRQSFPDWEMIICDDGSGDNTYETLIRLTEGDPRFVILRNDTNRRLGHALNRCISAARGKYLARQDADDTSHPGRLEEQYNYLEQHPETAVLGTYIELFDKDAGVWGANQVPEKPVLLDWIKGSAVIHASVMMRADMIADLGGYDENTHRLEDYDLWMRCIAAGYRIETLPRYLYSVHWNLNDYGRRKFMYRFNEIQIRYKGYRRLPIPIWYYLYLIKPLAAGLLPNRLLFRYHYRSFRK